MNWMNCGVSNSMSLNTVICILLSRGVSMRATKSSKYSVTPLNEKDERKGRTERVLGDGCRVARSGQDRGDWNPSVSLSRLVNAERIVTIALGEMYPE